MAGKINFSPGAKISWRLVQKWPRYKTKIVKTPKMDPKKRFFLKNPPFFELLKPVPESPHQTNFFWPGHQFCPKVPSRAVWSSGLCPLWWSIPTFTTEYVHLNLIPVQIPSPHLAYQPKWQREDFYPPHLTQASSTTSPPPSFSPSGNCEFLSSNFARFPSFSSSSGSSKEEWTFVN